MPFSSGIPHPLLQALARIEPDAKFVSHGSSHVQSLSSNQSYFVKMGHERDIEQYVGEAESLRAMAAACSGICPNVFECSVEEATKRPIFISEYKSLNPLNKNSAAELGRLLAEMHVNGHSPTGQFGFAIPTYCGSTRMRNGWEHTWEKTFDKMMGDLLKRLEDTGEFEELCRKGNLIRNRAIPQLLGSLQIGPVILHGDLWSGNAGTECSTGKPVIFDPSSYYGHNEADLAIARIFGGFPPEFFTAYHEEIPPSHPAHEYDMRGALYELFHYLNHTVLFGESDLAFPEWALTSVKYDDHGLVDYEPKLAMYYTHYLMSLLLFALSFINIMGFLFIESAMHTMVINWIYVEVVSEVEALAGRALNLIAPP